MSITLNPNLSTRLTEGMAENNGAQLPFLAPTIWVHNGDPRMRQFKNAQYFGGFAAKTDEMITFMNTQNQTEFPTGFESAELITDKNTSIDALIARHVVVAPIAIRQSSTKDGQRYAAFTKGGRPHAQALCLLATKVGTEYHPYGPVILSAKGYQVRNLTDSFGAWNKHTAVLRAKVAPNVPAWCFYLAVGTFGKDIKQISVGSGSQSSITPIEPYLPPNLTEQTLETLFVGEETAGLMASYLDMAQDWLKAWKTLPGGNGKNGQSQPAQNGVPEDDDFWPSQPPAGLEDEIPF